MPLYEAVTDKLTLVLDIGSVYTKFGFTGEFSPRCIIRTQVKCKKTNKLKPIMDYKTPEELYDMLVDFLHNLYFKYALVSPKDRPIVIVESLLCPTLFRETLAKVLFNHYEISTMYILPSHLVALACIPAETGLVVDVGYKEAVVFPICHGLPIVQAWQALPIASEAVHNYIRSSLAKTYSTIQNAPELVIEDIKVRTCFVTKKSRADQLAVSSPEFKECPNVVYPFGGSDVLTIPGKLREKAYEVLYEEDNDHLCLSTMILDAILKVDLDLRPKLAENLVLVGGTSMALGFKARLKEELETQLKKDRYKNLHLKGFKFLSLPCKENYVAWLGGSIYGATELLALNGLTRENYFKENKLPDWINLKDNVRNL